MSYALCGDEIDMLQKENVPQWGWVGVKPLCDTEYGPPHQTIWRLQNQTEGII